MKNPISSIHQPRLKPEDLLARINEMLWDVEECFWYINSMEDLRNKWMKLCAYLLQIK